MPKRSSKPSRDLNKLAAQIVGEATSEDDASDERHEKDPAAVALGRRGGKKGGPARARVLSAEQRQEIARMGAAARWADRRNRQLEPTDDESEEGNNG